MRKRHKKSEMPFAEALEFAQKRLAKATKEKEQAVKVMSALDVEIPSLQATIAVLEQQLNPSKDGIPANIAVLQPTVYETYGGITRGNPYPEPTEEELLPEPEGTELIPEN